MRLFIKQNNKNPPKYSKLKYNPNCCGATAPTTELVAIWRRQPCHVLNLDGSTHSQRGLQ
jgi:hypothetical protein